MSNREWFDKPRFDWMPANVLLQVARAFSYGGMKYSPYDWKGRSAEYFIPKILRHMNEYQMGVTEDEDTGLHPLAHMIADSMMLLWHVLKGESKTTNRDIYEQFFPPSSPSFEEDECEPNEAALVPGYVTPFEEDWLKVGDR